LPLALGSWQVNAPATPAFPTSMSVSRMPDPELDSVYFGTFVPAPN
jgi:hypothetical protein